MGTRDHCAESQLLIDAQVTCHTAYAIWLTGALNPSVFETWEAANVVSRSLEACGWPFILLSD